MPQVTKTFYISQESFYNNGQLLLPLLTDSAHNPLEGQIRSWMNHNYTVDSLVRSDGRFGISATSLNIALRNQMNISVPTAYGECYVKDGMFLHNSKEGFDFAIYDDNFNICNIVNSFVGNPGKLYGDTKIDYIYNKVLNIQTHQVYDQQTWRNRIAPYLVGTLGNNINATRDCMTIVGELQFGNWALVKHDLLRLLNSSESAQIDYYIYVAATGNLKNALSAQIVTYDSIRSAIEENQRLIKTPLWVIGLDFQ